MGANPTDYGSIAQRFGGKQIDYSALAKQYGATKSTPADPRDFSDKYNTPLNSQQQTSFDKWADQKKATTGKDPRNDRYDYDVNGYFLSGKATDPRGHATDEFKKPNHPTFSNESIYNGKDGNYGGQWIESGGKTLYTPSPTNLKFRPISELQDYFSKTEPDAMLVAPAPDPQPPAALSGAK